MNRPCSNQTRVRTTGMASVLLLILALGAETVHAATNAAPVMASDLPNMGASVVRVLGSLALVLGVFFGGIWLFRNWQRLQLKKTPSTRLRIQEVRPLSQRQAIYLVQCDDQRFLVGSSPSGLQFLTHLDGDGRESDTPLEVPFTAKRPQDPSEATFGQTLQKITHAKT